MAIAEDSSTPPVITDVDGAGTYTTSSFSPPSNSLVVVMSAGGWGNSNMDVTVTDSSGGGNWSGTVNPSGAQFRGGGAIHYKYFSTAPGSITVSSTIANTNAATVVATKVLTGTNGADPIGAIAQSDFIGGGATQNITPTAVGSWFYGAANNDFLEAQPNNTAETSDVAFMGAGSSAAWAFQHNSNPVENTNTLTLGGNWSGESGAILVYEILAASGTDHVHNASDTLSLSDSTISQTLTTIEQNISDTVVLKSTAHKNIIALPFVVVSTHTVNVGRTP